MTDDTRNYLDEAIAQIDERLKLEVVCERLPVAGQMRAMNKHYNHLMHRLAVLFQKYPVSILHEEIEALGYKPEEAAKELTEAIQAVRKLAVMGQ